MSYDPHEYWQRRGADYHDPPPHLEAQDELANLVEWVRHAGPGTVLEVGPGWGRIYLALRGAGLTFADFRLCDIAPSMLDGCQQRTGMRPDPWDGRTLPYPDGAFDLVISFSVLLHVPPPDLARHFGEIVRVSRSRVFVATCTEAEPPLAPHCFLHDYGALLGRFGLNVEKTKEFAGEGWTRFHWLFGKKGI